MTRKTVGPYQIVEKLGEGGMGVVYKAVDTKLNRPVALKFLSSAALEDEGEKERFLREARAAARLDHPSICMVYEVGEDDGHPYLAMQYLEGRTIRKTVREEPLPVDEAIRLAVQVLDGLADAHEEGIVHRDIKSSNIMITTKGRAKILDFGLATLPGAARITHAGSTLGTAAYMSPEQAQGESTDARTDLWSFGVVLYEMLTGQLPFSGTLPAAMLYAVVHEKPAPLVGVPAELRPGLEAILARALAKSPHERYATALDFAADLEALANEHGLTTPSGSRIGVSMTHAAIPRARAETQPAASAQPAPDAGAVESAASGGTAYPSAGTTVAPPPPVWKRPGVYLAALAACTVLFFALGGPERAGFAPAGPGGPPPPPTPTVGNPGDPGAFSIAVLPLASIGAPTEGEEDFFADGLTDSLIGQLAKIEGLSVISRTSVMAYKGTAKPLTEIAAELNVRHVIEGSVRKAGNQVRVQTQLVNAMTGTTLWSETYDRKLDDLLAIESDVAMAVAKAIDVKLTTDDEKRMHAMHAMNPAALQICMRAREKLRDPSIPNLRTAEALFREALEIDPNCGDAYEGLSFAYATMALAGALNPVEALPKARENAQKAIETNGDMTSSKPHLAMAIASAYLDWDWEAARRHFEDAIKLRPGLATPHILFAENYYLPKGELVEAEKHIRLAHQLDPRNPATITALGHLFALQGRPDDAIRAFDRAIEHDADYVAAHWERARVMAAQGKMGEALADVRKLRERGVRSPVLGAGSAYLYALLGREPDMSWLRRERGERKDGQRRDGGRDGVPGGGGGPPYISPYWAATVAAAKGDGREMFQWLGQGVNLHDPLMAQLRTAPEFAKYREERGFGSLLRRMNLGD